MNKLEAIKSLKEKEPGYIFSTKKDKSDSTCYVYIICEEGFAKELSFDDASSTIHLSSRRYSIDTIINHEVTKILSLEANKYRDLSQAIFILYSLETKADRDELYKETKDKMYKQIVNILS